MASFIWGVDIGYSAIKAVKMQRAGDTAEILDYAVIEIEPDDDENTRPLRLQNAFKELMETKRIGAAPVVLSVPGNQAFFRPFNLPPVAADKVEEIVQYEANQQIPFPLEEVEWGWQHHDSDDEGATFGVDMVAVRKDIVYQVLSMADNVGMTVVGLQSAPLGLFNYVMHEYKPEQTVVVLDVGAKETDFLVIQGDHWWVRPLPMSGQDVTRLLEQKFRYSRDEAEEVKLKMRHSKQAQKIFKVVQPSLRNMANEVQRTLGYYKSQTRGVRVGTCYLTGNSSKLMDLDKFLHQALRLPIEKVEGLQRIRGADDATFQEELPGMTVAIGLGLQGLGLGALADTVELLPHERQVKLEVSKKKPMAMLAAAILIVAVALSWLAANNRLAEINQDLTKVEEQIRTIQNAERALKAKEQQKINPMNRKAEVIARMGREQGWFAHCYGELLRKADEGVFGPEAANNAGAYMRHFYMSRTPPIDAQRNQLLQELQLDSFGDYPYLTLPAPRTASTKGDSPMYCVLAIEFGPVKAIVGGEEVWLPARDPVGNPQDPLYVIQKQLSQVDHYQSLDVRRALRDEPVGTRIRKGPPPKPKTPKPEKPEGDDPDKQRVYRNKLTQWNNQQDTWKKQVNEWKGQVKALMEAPAVSALPSQRDAQVKYSWEVYDETTDETVVQSQDRPHIWNALYWVYDDGSDKLADFDFVE